MKKIKFILFTETKDIFRHYYQIPFIYFKHLYKIYF